MLTAQCALMLEGASPPGSAPGRRRRRRLRRRGPSRPGFPHRPPPQAPHRHLHYIPARRRVPPRLDLPCRHRLIRHLRFLPLAGGAAVGPTGLATHAPGATGAPPPGPCGALALGQQVPVPAALSFEMSQLADAGGVGAIQNGALGPTAHPVPISELLSVSEEAVIALFGTLCTAALRIPPDESVNCIKDFNARAKSARTLASLGQPSPQIFFKQISFFYFQQDHALLLRSLPLDLAKLNAWAYGFGRWSIVALVHRGQQRRLQRQRLSAHAA